MTDIVLVGGLTFGFYSVTTLLAFLLARQISIFWALASVVCVGAAVWAWGQQPDGFALSDVPGVYIRVLASLFN